MFSLFILNQMRMKHKRGEGPQKRETRTMQHRSQKTEDNRPVRYFKKL